MQKSKTYPEARFSAEALRDSVSALEMVAEKLKLEVKPLTLTVDHGTPSGSMT